VNTFSSLVLGSPCDYKDQSVRIGPAQNTVR